MVEMSRQEIVDVLVANGTRVDVASLYADAYLEYSEALANIEKCGILVQHPKSGAPIQNPYLSIRDRAAAKMVRLRPKGAAKLWPSF